MKTQQKPISRPIPPLICGGQGRTAEHVRQDAAGLVALLIGALSGAVVVAAVWVAWAVLR